MVERCVACQRCDTGTLVPLSDYGGEGATLVFKAWVCTNPACGFNLKIRKGKIHIDEPVLDGATRPVVPQHSIPS